MKTYANWRLLNAIVRPTLWKNIEDYIKKLDKKDWENWSVFCLRMDVTNFVAQYYPDAFEKHDKSMFAMMTRIFDFFKETTLQEENQVKDFVFYHPEKYGWINDGEDEETKDTWNTNELLRDAEDFYNYKKENRKNSIRFYYGERNPLYDGENEFNNNKGSFNEQIIPKQSLEKHIIISDESKTGINERHFLRDDFYYKTDILKRALKGDDEKYNKKVLKEFYGMCRSIMRGKYIWDGKECDIKDIKRTYIKIENPEVFYNNEADLDENELKKAVWSHETAFCIYNYYCKTKDKEVYNFFLKILVMAVFQLQIDDCRDKWDSLDLLSNKELEELFTEELFRFFKEIKLENDRIINEIFDKISGKEELIFNKEVTREDLIEFEPALYGEPGSISILNHNFHSFANFSFLLPDGDVFKIKGDDPYKEWLLTYVHYLGKKADEYYKNNKSYKKLIINRRDIKDDRDVEYVCPNIDFSILKEELELYYLDDLVKTGYWKVNKNKEKLENLNMYYKIIRPEDTQIDDYIHKQGYVINKGIDSKIFQDLDIIFNTLLDDVKTPEDFAAYIEKQKTASSSLTVLRDIYEEFLEKQMDKVHKITTKWNALDAETVSETLTSFFKELKDNVMTLYSGNLSKEQYDNIIKDTKSMITTGETLYHTFISKKQKLEDYGVIAINYYRTLEYLLNQILYNPYKIILDKAINDIINEKRKKDPSFKNLREKHTMGYYGVSYGRVFDRNTKKNKATLTLGEIDHLFDLKEDESDIYLTNFLKEKNVNIAKLKAYVKQLKEVTNLRNECAHPNVTSEAFAVRGRIVIYKNEDKEKAKDEKRASKIFEMILKIKELFN